MSARNTYAPGKNVRRAKANNVNRSFPGSYHPPYKDGTQVVRFTTTRPQQFVRVHGSTNQIGAWVMRKSAINKLTPAQIQQKYALPAAPTHVSDVNVPAGTRMEYGMVNPGFPGIPAGGRARQYRLLERISTDSFTNMRPL